VNLSNDKNCILASSLDNHVRLLDKDSGELLGEYDISSLVVNGPHTNSCDILPYSYTGHINKQYKISSALTNTDAYVVSGSEDNRVCFWDIVEVRSPVALTALLCLLASLDKLLGTSCARA